jgi:hypothetical protein
MEELHEEAAGRACGRRGGAGGSARCSAEMSGRIAEEWLPEVQALLEHLQGNPEVEERLANLAAGMQSATQEAHGSRDGPAEQYDIGGDDDAWDNQCGRGHDDASSAPVACPPRGRWRH